MLINFNNDTFKNSWKNQWLTWIDLIDATHAIILTLLAIELLTIIQESIKEVTLETHSAITLASMIGIFIIGYFAIFKVIYDV